PTSTSFTNGTNTDYYWAYRNDFTVYYVPNSELSKTVTRTINITEPGKATQTVTQTATISRNSYLNNNDNGVVYSDWSTGNWSAQNVPTHEGYTMSATQTVNGVTTPLTLVNGQVPAETVTGTTQNTTINITWGAVATATLTGNGESTYNGQAITNGELNNGIHVTVTGPTASSGTYTLQNGDVEFSTDGTTWSTSMPINAGKYQVRLTTQGETGIKNQFGNNSIVWTSDGKSTITSNATYTINKLDSTATMANAQTGNYEMTYNGAAPSAIDPAKFQFTAIVNGQAPVNADSQPYTIVLNSDAIEGIIKQAVGNGQNDVSNVKFASDAISGSANYTITPLESSAELSNITDGNYTKVYNAETTNQIDASKLHITANLGGQNVDLDTTGITGSDYQWVDASGTALSSNPKNVGTYYIKLSDTAFARLQAQNPNFQLTSNDGLGVYTITPTTANITFGGTNSRVYNGEGTTTAEINSNGQIKIHFTFPGSVSDASYTLKDRDYYLVDQDGAGYDGAQIINVGTYTIKLTQQGMQNVIDTIHQLSGSGDSGYNINVDSATQLGNLTSTFNIVPSQNTISVSGAQTETYNGLPINVVYNADGTNSVKVSIAQTSGNTTGAVASLADVALDSGDFAIVNDPAENAGSYQVKLTDAGLAKIQNAVGDNYSLSLADTTGTLVINKAKANAVFSGDPKYTYTGTPVSSDDYLGKYSIKLTEPNNPTYNLVAGDIEFNVNGHWTTQAPVKVGTYQVRLSQSGWNHIKAINSDNVEWSATASAGTGTYTIKQANVTTELSGNNSMTYNGSAVTTNDLYSQDSTIKVVING
ncbi:MBG domain-containing protein, partial [Lactobacillus paragasseri]